MPTHGTTLDALGDELERWFAAEYLELAGGDAWKPEYLEYQFSCSAPAGEGEQVLAADEYAQGRLDWYSFDRTPGSLGAAGDPGEHVTVSSFLPAPVSFEGMPDSRWWALEDRKTDFGGVKPSTTDLAQLLLMEFALVYADNWFLAPFRLPVGALARLDGMAVTNTFGERFWILPAGTDGAGSGRWSMFELTAPVESEGAGAGGLLLPPVVVDGAGSAPLEDVELARDEVANMVWAVERTVPSVTGRGRSGKDEARETRQYHELLVSAIAEPPEYRADVAYLATSSVPEHFIPFVPVHVDGSVREIQLQRSRMLRIIEGDPLPPEKVPPRTTLMREGLDQPVKQPYFVHEEEVPRAGARVTVSFRRARGSGGEAYVWLGRLEAGRPGGALERARLRRARRRQIASEHLIALGSSQYTTTVMTPTLSRLQRAASLPPALRQVFSLIGLWREMNVSESTRARRYRRRVLTSPRSRHATSRMARVEPGLDDERRSSNRRRETPSEASAISRNMSAPGRRVRKIT